MPPDYGYINTYGLTNNIIGTNAGTSTITIRINNDVSPITYTVRSMPYEDMDMSEYVYYNGNETWIQHNCIPRRKEDTILSEDIDHEALDEFLDGWRKDE